MGAEIDGGALYAPPPDGVILRPPSSARVKAGVRNQAPDTGRA